MYCTYNFVVTKTSFLGIPLLRIARPTSFSFPYELAVSRCRYPYFVSAVKMKSSITGEFLSSSLSLFLSWWLLLAAPIWKVPRPTAGIDWLLLWSLKESGSGIIIGGHVIIPGLAFWICLRWVKRREKRIKGRIVTLLICAYDSDKRRVVYVPTYSVCTCCMYSN